MKFKKLQIEHVNNVYAIGVDSTHLTVQNVPDTAKKAYDLGAQEMARMIREKFLAGDTKAVFEILKVAETKSFYN